MSGDTAVKEQTCERCREGINHNFARDTERLNAHSDDITDLKVLMTEVVQLQKSQIESQKIQTEQLEEERKTRAAMELRIQKLETAAQEKLKFWNTDTGKLIVKAAIVVAFIIILAAIGQSADVSVKDLLGK